MGMAQTIYGYVRVSTKYSPHTWGWLISTLISVMQITPHRVAYHEKHVVHLTYKTRRLEKATDVKLIENSIV